MQLPTWIDHFRLISKDALEHSIVQASDDLVNGRVLDAKYDTQERGILYSLICQPIAHQVFDTHRCSNIVDFSKASLLIRTALVQKRDKYAAFVDFLARVFARAPAFSPHCFDSDAEQNAVAISSWNAVYRDGETLAGVLALRDVQNSLDRFVLGCVGQSLCLEKLPHSRRSYQSECSKICWCKP